MARGARLYPNECVSRIVAAIPPGHYHIRLLVEFRDGTRIILHEATVAAIVRAYVDIITHPSRRGVILESRRLSKSERKPGYAEWQLVEAGGEEEAVNEIIEALGGAQVACSTSSQGQGRLEARDRS